MNKPNSDSEEMYINERFSPYRLLWLKVIIRAAYDYALWKDSPELRHRKFAEEAGRWLFEPSSLEFSFTTICYKFKFPESRLRDFAKNLTKEDVKKLEFKERHGRDPLLSEISTISDDVLGITEDGDS